MEPVTDVLNKLKRARQVAKVLSTICMILILLSIYRHIKYMELEKQFEECQKETVQ